MEHAKLEHVKLPSSNSVRNIEFSERLLRLGENIYYVIYQAPMLQTGSIALSQHRINVSDGVTLLRGDFTTPLRLGLFVQIPPIKSPDHFPACDDQNISRCIAAFMLCPHEQQSVHIARLRFTVTALPR